MNLSSIAAGPTINWSRIDIKRGLLFGNPAAFPSDTYQYTGQGVALGGNLGVMWEPCQYVSFGVNYRLPSTMHYNGTSTYNNPNGFGPASGSVGTSADFQFPQIISGGISLRPTPNWNVEADVDWSDWHTLRNVHLEARAPSRLSGALGGKIWLSSSIGTAAISMNSASPAPSTTAGGPAPDISTAPKPLPIAASLPAVPDTTLNVQRGRRPKGEHFNWALAGQIIEGPKRTVAGSTPSASVVGGNDTANGTYQLFVPTITLGVGYHF